MFVDGGGGCGDGDSRRGRATRLTEIGGRVAGAKTLVRGGQGESQSDGTRRRWN